MWVGGYRRFSVQLRETLVANHLRHSEAAGTGGEQPRVLSCSPVTSEAASLLCCSFISHLSSLYTHFSGTLINCQSRISKAFTMLIWKTKVTTAIWNDIQPGYHICCLSQKCTLGRRLEVKYSYKTSLKFKHLHIYNKRQFVVPDNIFHSWTYWVSKLDRANAKQF